MCVRAAARARALRRTRARKRCFHTTSPLLLTLCMCLLRFSSLSLRAPPLLLHHSPAVLCGAAARSFIPSPSFRMRGRPLWAAGVCVVWASCTALLVLFCCARPPALTGAAFPFSSCLAAAGPRNAPAAALWRPRRAYTAGGSLFSKERRKRRHATTGGCSGVCGRADDQITLHFAPKHARAGFCFSAAPPRPQTSPLAPPELLPTSQQHPLPI